jgi:hypothetical protein
MSNMAIFFGVDDIRAGIPPQYLAVPGIVAVGATGGGANRAARECDRCTRRWDAHGWLVYASTGVGIAVLDCSEMPRAASGQP